MQTGLEESLKMGYYDGTFLMYDDPLGNGLLSYDFGINQLYFDNQCVDLNDLGRKII